MVDEGAERASKIFAKYYSSCGKPVGVHRPESSITCSNEHFFVETSNGIFFLKQLKNADALFENGGIARLDTVCQTTSAFARSGLPVEEIVANDRGELLTINDQIICRVYKSINGRPAQDTPADIEASAYAMGRLHLEGDKLLDKHLVNKLRSLKTPYPLSETRKEFTSIKKFIEQYPQNGEFSSVYSKIKDELGFIDFCLTQTNQIVEATESQLPVHLDFHPDNVLISRLGEAVIIDFDNMMYGSPMKCSAFSVLRFAWMKHEEQTIERLGHVLSHWRTGYQKGSGNELDDSIHAWMIYLELEKVLRIVMRHQQTNSYGQFLDNILRRHIPNLKLLLS